MSRHEKDLSKRYRIAGRSKFRLKDIDPGDTGGVESKEAAAEQLEEEVVTLCELQEKLYAQAEWSLLIVLQAMDAAGKDATIKHVLSGVNPQSCTVTSWKKPSDVELGHDFLWRAAKALPKAGHIGILNRSYYEEVLMVRVHPDYLENQHLPKKLVTKRIWPLHIERRITAARRGTELISHSSKNRSGDKSSSVSPLLPNGGAHKIT